MPTCYGYTLQKTALILVISYGSSIEIETETKDSDLTSILIELHIYIVGNRPSR